MFKIPFLNSIPVTGNPLLRKMSRKESMYYFKENVHLVEIEAHSYCNRTCWFCPNEYIDRRSDKKLFDVQVFKTLIDDLSIIDYKGMVGFARYSEAFYGDEIFELTRYARKKLPECNIHINSNGDYLTKDVLEKANEGGVSNIRANIYLPKGQDDIKGKAHEYIKKFTDRLSFLDFQTEVDNPVKIYLSTRYKNVNLFVQYRNFSVTGTNRGKLNVSGPYERIKPCLSPFQTFTIDYNNAVLACCNVRSDIDEHKNMIIGNLNKKKGSVFDIYGSEKMSSIRKSMLTYNKKSGPCSNCSHSIMTDKDYERYTFNESV